MAIAALIGTIDHLAGRRLKPESAFPFACHAGLACFNSCCSGKRLALLPYDVLRLRRALAMRSQELLERHAELEIDPVSGWPVLRLRLDGAGRCPFVTAAGCSVYPHRPTCCRIYPLARAVAPGPGGTAKAVYLLEKRPAGCLGMDEPGNPGQTVAGYVASQGLAEYQLRNDRTSRLLLHPRLQRPVAFTADQTHAGIQALYNLDVFRQAVSVPGFAQRFGVDPERTALALAADEDLLAFGHDWLEEQLVGPR